MLHQQAPTVKFKTSLDGAEVEGQIVDIQQALSYCVDSNTFMYDTLYGNVIFKTATSDGI